MQVFVNIWSLPLHELLPGKIYREKSYWKCQQVQFQSCLFFSICPYRSSLKGKSKELESNRPVALLKNPSASYNDLCYLLQSILSPTWASWEIGLPEKLNHLMPLKVTMWKTLVQKQLQEHPPLSSPHHGTCPDLPKSCWKSPELNVGTAWCHTKKEAKINGPRGAQGTTNSRKSLIQQCSGGPREWTAPPLHP